MSSKDKYGSNNGTYKCVVQLDNVMMKEITASLKCYKSLVTLELIKVLTKNFCLNLQKFCDVIHLDSGVDYRLRSLPSEGKVYFM